MNLFKNKKEEEEIKVVTPKTLGWLEKKLSDTEMDYLWRCIENRKGSHKGKLAGNIHESNVLIDRADWFFTNTLLPLCDKYAKNFENLGDSLPAKQSHPYYLSQFWVNYQKQNEFNPLHDHNGVYSFVIWMKIPTRHEEQNKNPIAFFSNSYSISTFKFYLTDILGRIKSFTYQMNPEIEGTMLFFPSRLNHTVYPFYNCEEDRISISGNIQINTSKPL